MFKMFSVLPEHERIKNLHVLLFSRFLECYVIVRFIFLKYNSQRQSMICLDIIH